MARVKATITLDRAKAAEARELVGAESISDVVDKALDHLIRGERLHRDIAAYRDTPATAYELVLATIAANDALADETDWAALYDIGDGDGDGDRGGGR